MPPDSEPNRLDPQILPPASTPTPALSIFSDAAAKAALARLKAKAAAQTAAAPAPTPPAPEAVEISAEELANNPEGARRRFEAIVANLREAFAAWIAAKEEYFEQVQKLGWSGAHEDMAAFLDNLDLERERLRSEAEQADEDVFSTKQVMELENIHERLAEMKLTWDKLRSEGVPIEKRPLDADLTWSLQFQAQPDADPTGEDMKWWLANRHKFDSLE